MLDFAVLAFAAWTLIFEAAAALGAPRDAAIGAWLVTATATGFVTRAWAQQVPDVALDPSHAGRRGAFRGIWIGVALCVGFLAHATNGAGHRWWPFWTAMVFALLVSVVASFRLPDAAPVVGVSEGVVVVILLAGVMAAASALVQRPDLDDVFVVNRAVYVAEHRGPMPIGETLFGTGDPSGGRGPLRTPAFEPFQGILARLTRIDAASVSYLLVAPLVAALSVLANWRLLRRIAPQTVLPALVATTGFLLLDGARHAGFGNFNFGRSWQGKVVLVAVVVPLLWHSALRWARSPSRQSWLVLAATNVAAAGLSSTAFFIAPTITGTVAAAGAITTRKLRVLLLGVCAAAHPLVLGVVNSTNGGLSQGEPGGTSIASTLAPWARWDFVLSAPAGFLAAAAIVAAVGLSGDRVFSLSLSLAALLVIGLIYGPEWLNPAQLVPGVGVVLWRAIWVLPVPALIGLLLAAPLRHSQPIFNRTLGVAGLVAALGLLGVLGRPVPSRANNARVGAPGWDVAGDLGAARRLASIAPSDSVVAAPVEIEQLVPLVTSRVFALDPRPGWYYPQGLDFRRRQRVQALVAGRRSITSAQLASDLSALNLSAVALSRQDTARVVLDMFIAEGFAIRETSDRWLFLARQSGKDRPVRR